MSEANADSGRVLSQLVVSWSGEPDGDPSSHFYFWGSLRRAGKFRWRNTELQELNQRRKEQCRKSIRS